MATFVQNIVNIGQVLKLETGMNVNTDTGGFNLTNKFKIKITFIHEFYQQ